MESLKTRNHIRWRILLINLAILAGLIALGTGMFMGYVLTLVKDEPLRTREDIIQEMDQWSQTSIAFFDDGKAIGPMRSEADRKQVQLKEISPYLIQGLIATEDRNFFHHHGVSPRSIFRAVYQYIRHRHIVTGGSTITQQLVKNTILHNREKTMDRKIREVLIALRVERLYSKREILTYYVNSLYFGKGHHRKNLLGIQAASRELFQVDARHLNLAQSAYLAGMIQRPNAYSPLDSESFQAGKRRMKTVLKRMLDNGYISKDQMDEALAFPLAPVRTAGRSNPYQRYPFMMSAVEEEGAKKLMQVEGLDNRKLIQQGVYRSTLELYRKKLLTGGYTIETTLNRELGDALNKVVAQDRYFAKPVTYRAKTHQGSKIIQDAQEEVGAVLMDTRTGSILAFIGGRDFNREQTNHAFQARRQPGSTIKPLLDYGPAIDLKLFHPGSILVDEPIQAQGNEQKVYHNYHKRYQGPVTLRQALRWSLNIPAIQVFRQIGPKTGFQYLKKMNFPIHRRDGEASAIGGFTRGFTVGEMTAGYAMLANQGLYQEPVLIKTITDSSGRVVYRHSFTPRRILSSQAAYLTTDLLRDVMTQGTGRRVGSRIKGYDIAGKTGTTQNKQDVWFIGYTPRVALGVWVGYDFNHPLPNDKRAKDIWTRLFRQAIQTKPDISPPQERFTQPEALETVEICTVSGKKATDLCRQAGETQKEQLPSEMIPADHCDLHRELSVVFDGYKEVSAGPWIPEDMMKKKIGILPPKDDTTFEHYQGTILPQESDRRISFGPLAPPRVRVSPHPEGVSISWSHTEQPGVAGYRLYRGNTRIASFPLGENLVFNGPPGDYSVRTVDVSGEESSGEPAILEE